MEEDEEVEPIDVKARLQKMAGHMGTYWYMYLLCLITLAFSAYALTHVQDAVARCNAQWIEQTLSCPMTYNFTLP